jgi:hypothetical protein
MDRSLAAWPSQRQSQKLMAHSNDANDDMVIMMHGPMVYLGRK